MTDNQRPNQTPRTATLLIAAGLLAGLWACGRERPAAERSKAEGVSSDEASRNPPVAGPGREQAQGYVSDASAPPAPASAIGQGGTGDPRDSVTPSMIIRTGAATIEVDSLEPAVAQLRQLAQRVGGFVANTSMQTGRNQLRAATLEIKLPAARWDDAIRGLAPIGTVESVSENTEDVGEEFVDISARVANARRLEERLVSLLATRTGKLEDVLAVERELARVREEIDRYEGRLRYLRSRVAMSTLTVMVHEPEPLVSGSPGTNVVGEAFRDAWRNFVHFIAWFIASLGWLVPLALIAWGVVVLARRWQPRRRRPPPTVPPSGNG